MQTQIGRYVLEAELGRGGFGTVYRAFDPTVGRKVAIKTLTAGGDAETLTRFRNEAASAGRLHHRNIVTIYDYGESDGEPYIVMELLEGRDLQHVIARKPTLPLVEKLRVMSEVAEGLLHAHRHGIVHRDVKPPNIMVMPDRSVKIMDFGIALVSQSATRLTRSGMVPGTLKYMAPEQFKGSVTDALSDIFSFGVTFYEFVAGVHPFEAPTSPAVMFRIVGSEPDRLRTHMPDCPELLEQVILRALSKDRTERYQTLEDLQLDLRPVLAGLQKQQARSLVEEARRHAEEGRQEDAQRILRRILSLDPTNADALDLRRKLQSASRTQNARARIEELLRTGRSRVEAGEYQQALETFEDVLRLDGANTQAKQLLETARTAISRAQSSRHFMREARQALSQGDVSRAIDAAQRAAEADPTSTEAFELTRTARSAMEEALSTQRALAQHAATIESARRAIANGRPADALAILDDALVTATQDGELTALRNEARAAMDAESRRHALSRVAVEARQLAAAHVHDQALQGIGSALEKFPDAPELVQLREESACAARARELARMEVLRKIRELRSANRTTEALECAATACAEFRGDSAMVALEQQLRAEMERASALHGIRHALKCGQPGDAATLAAEALAKMPDDGELLALEAEIRRETAARAKRNEIAATVAHVRALQENGSIEGAIAAVDNSLCKYPNEPELLVARDLALSARAKRERQRALKQAGDELEQLLADRRWDEAMQHLDSVSAQTGDDAALQGWRARIAQAAERHSVQKALESTRARITAGVLDQAVVELDAAITKHPGEVLLRQLRAETAAQLGDRTPPSKTAQTASPRSVRPAPIWAVVAALLLAAGGGTFFLIRPKPAESIPVSAAPAERNREPVPVPPAPAPAIDRAQPAGKPNAETPVVPQQERKPAVPPPATAPRPEAAGAPKSPPPAVEPRPNEESLWAAVNKHDAAALREFSLKHSSSRYARDAQRMAIELDSEAETERQQRAQAEGALREAERLRKLQADAAARAAEEAKKAEGLRAERNAIYAALARYASAFDQKDVTALQAAWPGIPADSLEGLKRAFNDKNVRMTMSLQPLADPDIHDSSATVAAQLSTMTIQKGRPSNSPVRKVAIQLVKRNSLWVIQSIQN